MPASSLAPACHALPSLSGAGLLEPAVRLCSCLHALHLPWCRLRKKALQLAERAVPWCALVSCLSQICFPLTAIPCMSRRSAASRSPPALLPEHCTNCPFQGIVSQSPLPVCRWLQSLQAQLQRLGLTGHAIPVCHAQHLVAAVALPQQGHVPAALLRLAGVLEQMELCSAAAAARSRAGMCHAPMSCSQRPPSAAG